MAQRRKRCAWRPLGRPRGGVGGCQGFEPLQGGRGNAALGDRFVVRIVFRRRDLLFSGSRATTARPIGLRTIAAVRPRVRRGRRSVRQAAVSRPGPPPACPACRSSRFPRRRCPSPGPSLRRRVQRPARRSPQRRGGQGAVDREADIPHARTVGRTRNGPIATVVRVVKPLQAEWDVRGTSVRRLCRARTRFLPRSPDPRGWKRIAVVRRNLGGGSPASMVRLKVVKCSARRLLSRRVRDGRLIRGCLPSVCRTSPHPVAS